MPNLSSWLSEADLGYYDVQETELTLASVIKKLFDALGDDEPKPKTKRGFFDE